MDHVHAINACLCNVIGHSHWGVRVYILSVTPYVHILLGRGWTERKANDQWVGIVGTPLSSILYRQPVPLVLVNLGCWPS